MAFSREAILELHGEMHRCLDIVLDHVTDDLLDTRIDGLGTTVGESITHVIFGEEIWVRALQALPDIQPRVFTSIEELRSEKTRVMAATLAYLDSLSERELNTEVAQYPDYWTSPRRAPAFILLHVITHTFHHKGQIAMMLRLLGHPLPDTDMQRP